MGGACPTHAIASIYTGNYTTSADANRVGAGGGGSVLFRHQARDVGLALGRHLDERVRRMRIGGSDGEAAAIFDAAPHPPEQFSPFQSLIPFWLRSVQ